MNLSRDKFITKMNIIGKLICFLFGCSFFRYPLKVYFSVGVKNGYGIYFLRSCRKCQKNAISAGDMVTTF